MMSITIQKTNLKMVIKMLKLTDTGRNLVKFMTLFAFIFLASGVFVCLFVTHDKNAVIPYISGVLVGFIFAVLKIALMERVMNKGLVMEPMKSRAYVMLHFVLRFTLTGAVFAVAATNPHLSFVGATLGLITMQPAAYVVGFLGRKKIS